MTVTMPPSPFLTGLMTPVTDERDDRDLAVTGQVPSALRGMFVRNGPNPQFAPKGTYHPFDGDGMVHAVYFEGGAPRYRNRWIESRGLLAERARGHALYGGLGEFTIPEPDVIAAGGMIKNTGNTHTVRHADRILALMEACPPTMLDRDLATRLGALAFGQFRRQQLRKFLAVRLPALLHVDDMRREAAQLIPRRHVRRRSLHDARQVERRQHRSGHKRETDPMAIAEKFHACRQPLLDGCQRFI